MLLVCACWAVLFYRLCSLGGQGNNNSAGQSGCVACAVQECVFVTVGPVGSTTDLIKQHFVPVSISPYICANAVITYHLI